MIGPVLGAKDVAIGPSTGQGDVQLGSLSRDPKDCQRPSKSPYPRPTKSPLSRPTERLQAGVA